MNALYAAVTPLREVIDPGGWDVDVWIVNPRRYVFKTLQFQKLRTKLFHFLALWPFDLQMRNPEHKTDSENDWAPELGLNLLPLCRPEIDITLTNPLPPGAVGLALPPGSLLWSGRWCHCRRPHLLLLLWWCQRLRHQICCWGLKLRGTRTNTELLDHSLFSSDYTVYKNILYVQLRKKTAWNSSLQPSQYKDRPNIMQLNFLYN